LTSFCSKFIRKTVHQISSESSELYKRYYIKHFGLFFSGHSVRILVPDHADNDWCTRHATHFKSIFQTSPGRKPVQLAEVLLAAARTVKVMALHRIASSSSSWSSSSLLQVVRMQRIHKSVLVFLNNIHITSSSAIAERPRCRVR